LSNLAKACRPIPSTGRREDELAGLTIAGGYEGPGRSPDRADAMVWALTELLLKPKRREPRVRFL
jgi:phage terminase large subunit-like protein